jgi:hypothetical protein
VADKIRIEGIYGSAEAAIIQPEHQLPLPAYNVDNWLPRLGAQRWALVQVLRRMALGAPQAADGTRRVETTRDELAQSLGVKWSGTIGEYLKSEPIPGRKGWRRLKSGDDEANQALAHFIPRLRYIHKRGQDGKTRRVGLALYVRMDEPLTAEDESRLDEVAARMAQALMEQRVLPDSPQGAKEENPASASAKKGNPISPVEAARGEKPVSRFPKSEKPTLRQPNAKEENPLSRPGAKEAIARSRAGAKEGKPTSAGRKVGEPGRNVNELTNSIYNITELIKQLDTNLTDGRRIRGQLTPVVKAAEDALSDYHSTGMLYKVLTALYRSDRLDLFMGALEAAIAAGAGDPEANLGAVFVSEIQWLSAQQEVDIGIRTSAQVETRQPAASTPREAPLRGWAEMPPASTPREAPLRGQAEQSPACVVPGWETPLQFWDAFLEALKLQMTQGTFAQWLATANLVDYRQASRESGLEADCLIIGVQNAYAADWLFSRLMPVLKRTVHRLIDRAVEIQFVYSGVEGAG